MKFAVSGIAFDLDGTLFDSKSVSAEALLEGFEAFWKELNEEGPVPCWEDAKHIMGLPTYDFFARLLPESHRHNWRLLHHHVGRCERKRLEQGLGMTFEGVHEVLETLAGEGYFLGCLSNASRVYFDAVLDGCNLRKYFHKLTFLGESPGLDKSIVLADWAHMLGGKDRLIYVGDRARDIVEAHAAGVKAVAVTFGYGTREELLAAGANALIDNFRELLTLVVRSPS